ncbi:DUF3592 domain-containing protein [Streptosporangium saharense]|uniref:DUF3592 domain-containing protein n=1 Tax=Streptosporangium saharense TaxID=1706840 RepID=UPI0033314A80
MARRPHRWFGLFDDWGDVRDFLMNGLFLSSSLLFIGWGLFIGVMEGVSSFDMYFHGVRATATVVSTRAVEQRTGEGGGTLHFTKIGFLVKDDWRVAEVSGEYSEGEKIPIIYDADDPSVVDKEFKVGVTSLLFGIISAAVLLGVVAAVYSLWRERIW